MKIKIDITDPESIDAACKVLDRVQGLVLNHCGLLACDAASFAWNRADDNLYNAQVAGGFTSDDAYVHAEEVDGATKYGGKWKVRFDGDRAGIIEFGSGIYNENSYQVMNGYFAGSYNPGSPKALQPWGWFYTGSVGSNPPPGTEEARSRKQQDVDPEIGGGRYGSIHTYGNPPNRVMYNALESVRENSDELVNDNFYGWLNGIKGGSV